MSNSAGWFGPWSETTDWDEKEDWSPETVARLVGRVVREFNDGRFGKDFEAKLAERGIPMQEVKNTLRSNKAYIALYRDDHDGTRRIGFWHPTTRLFVVWKPGRRSAFKTCFRKGDGEAYMRRLDESRPIRRPKRGSHER